jgi:hypothetical protein
MGVARILLTNRNHSRAANVVRERTGARTLIHPDDAAHARSQGAAIDGELSMGEKTGPLTIVAVPGKSPGEGTPDRGGCGDRQSGGTLRAATREGDGRSRALEAQRAQARMVKILIAPSSHHSRRFSVVVPQKSAEPLATSDSPRTMPHSNRWKQQDVALP